MDAKKNEDIKVILHNQYEAMGKKIDDVFYVPFELLEKGYNAEHSWTEREKTLKVHVTKARSLPILQYDYKGNYLHYDKNRVENWNVEFDSDGIPKTVYSFGKFYNPSTIAQYGLEHYSLYLITKDKENEQKFINTADWFIHHQDTQGGWAYQFELDYYPSRLNSLKTPWYSAIGLGMAMSVLSRASYLTGEQKYSERAIDATNLFLTPSVQNGILAKFEDTFLFYEECPTNPPSFILNGFMFALIGLYDLYNVTNDSDTKKLYEEGIRTLKRMLPLYDLGNRTAYDLTHYTTDGGFPNVAKWGYHITHIHLLDAIYSIEKDPKMKETLLRWKGYLLGKS